MLFFVRSTNTELDVWVCYPSHHLWGCARLSLSDSEELSPPLLPSVGDDDDFSVVALERDTEGSEGKAVLSTGTGHAEDIQYLLPVFS